MRRVFGVVWWSWLVVWGAAVASAQSPTPDAIEGRAPAGAPLRIEGVTLGGEPELVLRLDLSGPVETSAHRLPASGKVPERIYVDLPAEIRGGLPPMPGQGPVLGVRAAPREGGATRVVVDVKPGTNVQLRNEGTRVLLVFTPPVSVPAAPPSPATKERPKPGRTRTALASGKPAAPQPVAAKAAEPATPVPPGALAEAAVEGDSLGSAPLPPLRVEEPGPTLPPLMAHAEAPGVATPRTPAPEPEQPAAAAAMPAAEVGLRVEGVHGARFVWADVEQPFYQGDETTEQRRMLAVWRRGVEPLGTAPEPTTPAMYLLAADLAYLKATARSHASEGLMAALHGYERAARQAAEHPEAARAGVMIGFINLDLDFAPEARAAFRQVMRTHPDSPLVPYAQLGEVAALRRMRRVEEARALLEQVRAAAPRGDVACGVRLEDAALVRATGDAAGAATRMREIGAACPQALALPGALYEFADALAASGSVAEARRLLAARRDPRSDEEEARLETLAAELAGRDGDRDVARAALARAQRLDVGQATHADLAMRLARLEAADDPMAATGALLKIAEAPGPVSQRAAAFGEAADATAEAGRYASAMALLDRAAELGPEGEAQADGRRTELLGRWIGELARGGDTIGIVGVYAAHATAIQELAAPEDRIVVARALLKVGLPEPALSLLAFKEDGPAPELAVTRAEVQLELGNLAAAREAAGPVVTGSGVAPAIRHRAQVLLTRVALAEGDAGKALAALPSEGEPVLRAEVARGLVDTPDAAKLIPPLVETVLFENSDGVTLATAGNAALAVGDGPLAERLYNRAIEVATDDPTARAAATIGLARAKLLHGDRRAAARALVAAAEGKDRVIQKAALSAARALAQPSREERADVR